MSDKQRLSIRGRPSASARLAANDPRHRRANQAGTRGEDYAPPLFIDQYGRLAIDLDELHFMLGEKLQSLIRVSGNYTATPEDDMVVCEGAATVYVDLNPPTGRVLTVVRKGAGAVTVNGNGKNIDGASTFAIAAQYDDVTLTYDGVAWNASDG